MLKVKVTNKKSEDFDKELWVEEIEGEEFEGEVTYRVISTTSMPNLFYITKDLKRKDFKLIWPLGNLTS